MNLSQSKLNAGVSVLRDFGARRVLLFGSYAQRPNGARDVDLAVEGIPLRKLLEAEVRLSDTLGVPVDLVSREESPRFFELVQSTARVLHDERTDSSAN